MCIPVILCGGSGTRLWPLSRSQYPKQFMQLGETTLFGDTIDRARALSESPVCVVCNEQHRFLAASVLQEKHCAASILLETEGRNTAPAIALAALAALDNAIALPDQHKDKDPVLLVLPSDHRMNPLQPFVQAVNTATTLAHQNMLVTFGISPTGPETGFGYVRHGEMLPSPSTQASPAWKVAAFEEKPCLERAEELLASGQCSWNSGMFLFRAATYLEELNRFAPDMYKACLALWNSRKQDADFIRFNPDLFHACPANSIDYAVMEHTKAAAVVPLQLNWSDLGSWEAFHAITPKDENGNACLGDVVLEDVHNSYIHSTSRLVAALGVDDVVVVETPDAVLVSPRNRTQDVKKILLQLQQAHRTEANAHTKVFRPWGHYQTLVQGERFQVKRIEVKPGASLSLQKHHHRAEHWVVVHGTAEVTQADTSLLLTEDQSTYIPVGGLHRLHNPGCIPLVIIEIQTGSYLGEDDIVRLNDTYGR